MRRLSFVAVFCSLIALAGCGGSGSGSAPAPIPTYVPPSTGSYVYVTDGGSFVLQILQSQNGAINPASSIGGPSTQLSGATGIARDAAGNIYVADEAQNQILVFPPALAGNVTPKLVLAGAATGLSLPRGLEID